MEVKRSLLNARKSSAIEIISQLPPKDLLLAQLHHLENPPENAEVDCNPFDQSNLDHSSLESIISNTYSERLERDIAICHSLLIHSKLCLLDEDQQTVTNQLRKQLRTIFEYRDDRNDFDREYEDQYFLKLEELCINLPALLPNLIPINQTNQIMNHKDEGFLFRKVEEILSGQFQLVEMDQRMKYLQIVVDKLQTELQCLKTHENCVDLKLIRDVIFSLSILLNQDVKEYSKSFVNFGILDLLADYLIIDPNESSLKILDDILSVNGFIVRLYSELANHLNEESRSLSDWFLGGRSISAIINRLLKEVDKLSKELSRNTQEEIVDILDEDCDYHQQGLVVKYSLHCLLELSRKGLLQKYIIKSMNPEQESLFQILLEYLWNMLSDNGRIILVKIVANVVDIPKLTDSLLDDSCLLGCLYNLLESSGTFLHAMYTFVQLSWFPQIGKDEIDLFTCLIFKRLINEESFRKLTEIGVEVNRILQPHTNENSIYSKKFDILFHESVRDIIPMFPDASIVVGFLTNPTDENNCLSFIEMVTDEHNLQELSHIRTNLERRVEHYRRNEK